MTKPFDASELLARVNALARRKGEIIINEIKYADITLDLNSAVLHCADSSIQLTKKEFEVLKMLLSNSKQTVTKESILVNVWGLESDATENNIEAYISFIRRKLRYLKSVVTIKNIQGIGYRVEGEHA